jgi:hypothetical protein
MLYAGDKFRRFKSITGVTAITTIQNVTCADDDLTLVCVSGNLWVNPLTTAVADATAFKMTAGQTYDLNVFKTLSLISDVTGATYQIVKYV